jgi:hypothetical protein
MIVVDRKNVMTCREKEAWAGVIEKVANGIAIVSMLAMVCVFISVVGFFWRLL